jgi:hypothetical protein
MTNAIAQQPQANETAPVEDTRPAWERVADWLANRTPEEIEATRRRLDAASRPPRPLPEGKTLSDMVCGTWPGDETDEEVAEALERLS